jgi:hypothetical protein
MQNIAEASQLHKSALARFLPSAKKDASGAQAFGVGLCGSASAMPCTINGPRLVRMRKEQWRRLAPDQLRIRREMSGQ